MNSLDFTLSLIDNVTQPLKQAQSALSNFANESQKAFTQSAIGVAGLAGALFSLKGLLDPALQMNEAIQTASLQGADAESDDDLRDRCRNQFNLVGNYHTDAVYRGMIASLVGLSIDRIFFLHDAPRGAGTANAYLLLDSGVASQPFIDQVNDYVMKHGHHGHGDDMQCFAMPETQHALVLTVFVDNLGNFSAEQLGSLKNEVNDLVRCAFRENSLYQVKQTWPYSRFSFSNLGRELHRQFSDIQSLHFSLGDITSELNVPRLTSLVVEVKNV